MTNNNNESDESVQLMKELDRIIGIHVDAIIDDLDSRKPVYPESAYDVAARIGIPKHIELRNTNFTGEKE